MKNITFCQSVSAFKIERSKNLAGFDRTRNIRRILGDLLHHPIAQQVAVVVPSSVTIPLAQFVGHILNEASHDVLAGGRKRGIGIRCNYAIDPELFGDFSKLGDVVTAFGEFERWHKREERALLGIIARGRAGEARLFSKYQ